MSVYTNIYYYLRIRIYYMHIECICFFAYGTVHGTFAKHIIFLTHPQELLRHKGHYVILRCLHLAFQQMWHHVNFGNTQNRKPIATTQIINVHETNALIILSIDVIQKANG